MAMRILNDINVGAPPPGGGGERASFLERLFDEHSDGRFVKYLLIVMLLIASVAQPPSLIYTAYGDNLPTWWWDWAPVLGVFLFLALDWTILPLGYFFATTSKPGLKTMLFLLLAMVAFGAFDGYFATAERLISLRVQGITAFRLRVEDAEAALKGKDDERQKMLAQQAKDRDHLDRQRSELGTQIDQIDKQIAATQAAAQAEEAQYPDKIKAIKEACKIVAYVCVGPRLEAAEKHRSEVQTNSARQLDQLRTEKADLNAKLAAFDVNDESKVEPANQAVAAAAAKLAAARQDFDVAVLTSQVYRWAAAWYGKSPREVTAEEANRVLDTFAAVVALAYVLTQILLSISYYGRHRRGVVETNREFLRERVNRAWERVIGARRAYWVRKRRGVYRDRIREVPVTEYRDREVTKEVFVPTAERTKVIYVPVPPGGPVPPAEEFVRKANFEGTL